MKLAEALQERADLNKKIQQLSQRLQNNALVQEGEEPLDESIDRLQELMAHINKTNCLTTDNGETLTDLIANRDTLNVRIRSYRDLITAASGAARRYSASEIKILSTVNVRFLQKKLDEMSKQLRETDNRIQALNWTTELL